MEALKLKSVNASASAAPMNMVKPNKTRVENLPPSPPLSAPRSVSFSNELSIKYTDSLNVPNSNVLAISPAESIDIAVRDLSQDILVALVDRDTEMRELFVLNKDFFDTVKQSIFEDEERWDEFLKVLYSERAKISDSKWMDSISKFLSPNPPFLVLFKEIIGFYEEEDDDDVNGAQEESEDVYSCDMMNGGWIDISPLRNLVENLEASYPQFFKNLQEEHCEERQYRGSLLGGNYIWNDNPLLHPNAESEEDSSETLYDEFKRILLTPRSEMNDCEWETAIYECLDPYPVLLAQFEEIVGYEISE